MSYIDLYPFSFLAYIFVIFSAGLIAYVAKRRNRIFWVILLILILSFFLGLRGINTGTDTKSYILLIERNTLSTILLRGKEQLFYLLCLLLYNIFHSPYVVLLSIAFLTVAFFISRLWELREMCSFTTGVLFFVTFCYLYAFNVARQMLAVSIVFWATRYLFQGKYIRYIIIIAACALIHPSSAMSLLVLIIYDLVKNGMHFSLRRAFAFLFLMGISFYMTTLDSFNSLYSAYTSSERAQEGFSSFITITLVVAVFLVTYLNVFKRNEYKAMMHEEYKEIVLSSSITYVFSFFISLVLSSFWESSRLAYYFIPYGTIFWGYKYDSGNIRLIKRTAILLLVIRALYGIFTKNGNGIFPYEFFWNTNYF